MQEDYKLHRPDETYRTMELVEEAIRDKLRESLPNIDSIWSSSTKPPGKHPSLLRAEIVVTGEKACACFSAAREPVPSPEQWVGLSVVPILVVKFVYIQKSMAGLVLEVNSLMLGEPKEQCKRGFSCNGGSLNAI